MLKICTIIILIILFSLVLIFHLANKNSYKNYYYGKITDHFDGAKFHNFKSNTLKTNDKVLLNYFKNKLLGKGAIWPKNINVNYTNPINIINKNNFDIIFFINHATNLINIANYNILTDPIWSNYASPLQFLGPKRRAKPGVKFDDLPKIDIILISHSHYDHLDSQTIKRLVKSHNPIFIVGLGVGGILSQIGVPQNKIIELDWWENFKFPNSQLNNSKFLEITYVPAQHFSSRFLDDKNSTLWGGFVIKSSNKKIYFAGDTGFDSDQFHEIRKKFEVIDVSLLPIGAYKPDSFRYVHMNPEEAVKASMILESKINIPIHFGTFILSFENYYDPVLDLTKSLNKYNLDLNHFSILKNGEYKILN